MPAAIETLNGDVLGREHGRAKPPLDGLTSLRFVAAAMIVVQHSMGFLGISDAVAWHFPLHQGVSFFFVLSGFILAYVYRDGWNASRRTRFFVARLARVYPVHLFGFALVLLLLPRAAWILSDRPGLGAATANLLLIQSWIPVWHFFASFNSPSWSISSELLFYLSFPLLIVLRPHTSLIVTFAIAILIIALTIFFRLPYSSPDREQVIASGLLYNNPLPRLFEFGLGIFTHAVWENKRGLAGSPFRSNVLEIFSFVLVGASILFSPFIVQGLGTILPTGWTMPVGTYLGGTFSAIPFALLIYLVAGEAGFLSRSLRHPFAVRLGEISFSLYMIHGTLLIFYDVHKAAFMEIPLGARYLSFWLVLLLASWLVWFHVEVPARTRVLGWYDRSQRHGRPLATVLGRRFPGPGIGLKAIGRLFVFYLMCVAVGYAIEHPASSIHRVTADETPVDENNLLNAPVAFGGAFELRKVSVVKEVSGKRQIVLLWRAISDQRLEYTVAVHLLDDSRTIVAQADYPQDVASSTLKTGEMWEDVRPLPDSNSAKALGIALFHDEHFLLANGGEGDWGDRRLLVQFGSSASPDRSESATSTVPGGATQR